MKIRAFAGVVLLLLAGVLGWEFRWRAGHEDAVGGGRLRLQQLVAEVRSVPEAQASAPGTSGVFLRGRWAYLRAWKPQLVALGACDEVSARWFGGRRLVIECELRAGEPRLLRDSVDGVVIELVVNRRFAQNS